MQFWKSHGHYWCDVCKVWMLDKVAIRQIHEKGIKHQENVAKSAPSATTVSCELCPSLRPALTMRPDSEHRLSAVCRGAELRAMRQGAEAQKREEAQTEAVLKSVEQQAAEQYARDKAAAAEELAAINGTWEPDEGTGYLYNKAQRFYYDKASSMYYGGDPPEWTAKPAIPAAARYAALPAAAASKPSSGDYCPCDCHRYRRFSASLCEPQQISSCYASVAWCSPCWSMLSCWLGQNRPRPNTTMANGRSTCEDDCLCLGAAAARPSSAAGKARLPRQAVSAQVGGYQMPMTGVIGGLAGVGGAASVAQSQPAGSKARPCRAVDASTVLLFRLLEHRQRQVIREHEEERVSTLVCDTANTVPDVLASLTDCVLRCSGRGSRQAPAKQPRRQRPARKRQRGGKLLVRACSNAQCSSSDSASSRRRVFCCVHGVHVCCGQRVQQSPAQ
jgi:hypothetical protein